MTFTPTIQFLMLTPSHIETALLITVMIRTVWVTAVRVWTDGVKIILLFHLFGDRRGQR